MSSNERIDTAVDVDVIVNLRSVIEQVGDAAESVTPPTAGPDPVEPVVAHGALNSMAVLLGTLRELSESSGLSPEQARLVAAAAEQGRSVVAALRDLDLRLPMGATGLLDDLDEEARQRHDPMTSPSP